MEAVAYVSRYVNLWRWYADLVTTSKGKSDLILAAVLRMERFLEQMDSKIVSLSNKSSQVESCSYDIAEHDA